MGGRTNPDRLKGRNYESEIRSGALDHAYERETLDDPIPTRRTNKELRSGLEFNRSSISVPIKGEKVKGKWEKKPGRRGRVTEVPRDFKWEGEEDEAEKLMVDDSRSSLVIRDLSEGFDAPSSRRSQPAKRKQQKTNIFGLLDPCTNCKGAFDDPEFAYLKCGHKYCRGCIRQVVKISLESQDKVSLQCCGNPVSLNSINQLLTKGMREQYKMKHVEIENPAPISSEDAHKVTAKRAGRYSHLNDAALEDLEELENEPEGELPHNLETDDTANMEEDFKELQDEVEGELPEDSETEGPANTEEVRVECPESQAGGEYGNDEDDSSPE